LTDFKPGTGVSVKLENHWRAASGGLKLQCHIFYGVCRYRAACDEYVIVEASRSVNRKYKAGAIEPSETDRRVSNWNNIASWWLYVRRVELPDVLIASHLAAHTHTHALRFTGRKCVYIVVHAALCRVWIAASSSSSTCVKWYHMDCVRNHWTLARSCSAQSASHALNRSLQLHTDIFNILTFSVY